MALHDKAISDLDATLLMKRYDKDVDGQISYDEVRLVIKVIVYKRINSKCNYHLIINIIYQIANGC